MVAQTNQYQKSPLSTEQITNELAKPYGQLTSSPVVPPVLAQGIKYLEADPNLRHCSLLPIVKPNKGETKRGGPNLAYADPNYRYRLFNLGDDKWVNQWTQAVQFFVVVNTKYTKKGKWRIIVIDVDVDGDSHKNVNGFDYLYRLDLVNTLIVRTPSGGYHFIYTVPYCTKQFSRLNLHQDDDPIDSNGKLLSLGIDIASNSPVGYKAGEGYGPIDVDWDMYMRADDKRAYLDSCEVGKSQPICEMPESTAELICTKKVKIDREQVFSKSTDFLTKIDGMPMCMTNRNDWVRDMTFELACLRLPENMAIEIVHAIVDKCDNKDGQAPTYDEAYSLYIRAVNKLPILKDKQWMDEKLVYVKDRVRILNEPHVLDVSAGVELTRKFTHTDDDGGKSATQWLYGPGRMEADTELWWPGQTGIFEDNGLMAYNNYRAHINKCGKHYVHNRIDRYDSDFKLLNKIGERVFGDTWEIFLKAIVYKFLHPGVKFNWGFIITSDLEGTGKDMIILDFLKALFGNWNIASGNKSNVANEIFNDVISRSLYEVFDEIGLPTFSELKALIDKFKDRVSNHNVTIEAKNIGKVLGVEVFFDIIISGNHENPLKLTYKTRRWHVYHDGSTTKLPATVFTEFANIINSPDRMKNLIDVMISNVDITIGKDGFYPKGDAIPSKLLMDQSKSNNMCSISKGIIEVFKSNPELLESVFIPSTLLNSIIRKVKPNMDIPNAKLDLRTDNFITPIKDPGNNRAIKGTFPRITMISENFRELFTREDLLFNGNQSQDIYMINADDISELMDMKYAILDTHGKKKVFDSCEDFRAHVTDGRLKELSKSEIRKLVARLKTPIVEYKSDNISIVK